MIAGEKKYAHKTFIIALQPDYYHFHTWVPWRTGVLYFVPMLSVTLPNLRDLVFICLVLASWYISLFLGNFLLSNNHCFAISNMLDMPKMRKRKGISRGYILKLVREAKIGLKLFSRVSIIAHKVRYSIVFHQV